VRGAAERVLARGVAAEPGPRLLSPAQLPLAAVTTAPRGKVGRAVHTWAPAPPIREASANRLRTWRRILLGRGAELLVDDEHPLFAGGDEARLQALFQRILSDAVDGRPSPSSL